MKQNIVVVLGMLVLASAVVSEAQMEDRRPLVPQTPLGTSAGNVLFSQLSDPVGTFTDQAFEAGYAAYDAEGADDFVVADAAGWNLDQLFIAGQLSIPGVNPFLMNNAFYADAGGIPGAILPGCDFAGNANFTSLGDGDVTMDVTGCSLSPQTVWVSNQVRLDFNPFGQHFWVTQGAQIGDEGVWRNPGNGFGLGCPTWGAMNTFCGAEGHGFSLELSGLECCDTDGIPAIGPFGMVVMVLALGGGSAYVLRRRR